MITLVIYNIGMTFLNFLRERKIGILSTDWDSQSSEPQGLLFANRYQLGNFDQCLGAPWSATHKELKTKYCIADIMLQRTDKTTRKRVNPLNPYQSALDYIQVGTPFGA